MGSSTPPGPNRVKLAEINEVTTEQKHQPPLSQIASAAASLAESLDKFSLCSTGAVNDFRPPNATDQTELHKNKCGIIYWTPELLDAWLKSVDTCPKGLLDEHSKEPWYNKAWPYSNASLVSRSKGGTRRFIEPILNDIPANPVLVANQQNLDLLKAKVLVLNLIYDPARPINAHVVSDAKWPYVLTSEMTNAIPTKPMTGEALVENYNQQNFKAELDCSCKVIFPCENTSSESNQQVQPDSYSEHMGFGVYVMAHLLRSGQINSYEALWYVAREFRVTAPNHMPAMSKVENQDIDAFTISRFGREHQEKILPAVQQKGGPLYTCLSQTYRVFKNQFPNDHSCIINVHPITGNPCEIQLTRCELNKNQEQVLVHTPPESLPEILKILEHYFSKLNFNSHPNNSKAKTIQQEILFTQFWWAAHACLNARGSAAISDACLRALHLAAVGETLKPWRPGFAPDIIAMACSSPEMFLDLKKEQMFGSA